MNFLQRFAARLAFKSLGLAGISLTDQDAVAKLISTTDGPRSSSGITVNDTAAVKVSVWFAGIRLLAETHGAFPRSICERKRGTNGEVNLTPVDHDLAAILCEKPNADMNDVQYHETSTANLAARGNAYSLIERRSDGNVLSLYPVASSRMRVRRDSSTDWETMYFMNDRGKTEPLPPEKVWHRRLFGFDGLAGLSPLECGREALSLAIAGEAFNSKLFSNGLMPSARVSIPHWLDDKQRIAAKKKLDEMWSGWQNLAKPLLLEGGMKVESGLFTPEDAQFLALRQLTVVELCRLLGIKPHMVAALERATHNNIEQLSQEFVTFTMLPYVKRDEAAARQLFTPKDRARFSYKINVEGLLRADSAARAALYSILLQNGVFSRNEVRALENRNRSDAEGMDDYTVQLNMTLIQLLEQLTERSNNSTSSTTSTAG